jgi:Ferritin-like
MSTPKITTVSKLHDYLRVAMQLEHATIPPYLLALYSIHPGTNVDATQIIRVVVVEEMLHLTLAANILNAVGGTPDLMAPDFVPLYPAYLPDGENDFQVDLQPFSKDALRTFLNIERSKPAPSPGKKMIVRANSRISLTLSPDGTGLHYYSIGEFYSAIVEGLKDLHAEIGNKLFCGDPQRQVTAEYYYSGGGKLTAVTDLDSALTAVNLIIEQGEGFDAGIFNDQGELAHDFRFEQLQLGQYYQKGDKPQKPTGQKLHVDWNAVYPLKKNARLSDYEQSPELYAAAVAFNETYADFLALLTRAYHGEPSLLLTQAVPRMFALRNKITQLIHNPIPGMEGLNAAPTFEMAHAAITVTA